MADKINTEDDEIIMTEPDVLYCDIPEAEFDGTVSSWNRRADRTTYPTAFIEAKKNLSSLSKYILSLNLGIKSIPKDIFEIVVTNLDDDA